jgi:hypothetical protein
VQVALDPPALGVGGRDHAGAGRLQRVHAGGQPLALARLQEQPRHRDLHGGDAAGEPGRGVEGAGAARDVGDGGREVPDARAEEDVAAVGEQAPEREAEHRERGAPGEEDQAGADPADERERHQRVRELHPGAARAEPAQRAVDPVAVARQVARREVDAEERHHAALLQAREQVRQRERQDDQRQSGERHDEQRGADEQRRQQDEEGDATENGAQGHIGRRLEGFGGERRSQLDHAP